MDFSLTPSFFFFFFFSLSPTISCFADHDEEGTKGGSLEPSLCPYFSRKRVCLGPASNCGQGTMTLLLCVWRLSEREAGHNIYPLWEDETPQSQQSANNIHPPLVPFQQQKNTSVSELKVQTTWKITTGTAGSVTHRGKNPHEISLISNKNKMRFEVMSFHVAHVWIFICLNLSRFLQSKINFSSDFRVIISTFILQLYIRTACQQYFICVHEF